MSEKTLDFSSIPCRLFEIYSLIVTRVENVNIKLKLFHVNRNERIILEITWFEKLFEHYITSKYYRVNIFLCEVILPSFFTTYPAKKTK